MELLFFSFFPAFDYVQLIKHHSLTQCNDRLHNIAKEISTSLENLERTYILPKPYHLGYVLFSWSV